MGGLACLKKSLGKKSVRYEDVGRNNLRCCNCGWEIETGYSIAVGLAILEGKRIFLLAVGIFLDWNVLSFAGGLVPLFLTVLAAGIGVPVALAAVFTINKRRKQQNFPYLNRFLKFLAGIVPVCGIINILVICSFAICLNVSREKIAEVFSESMYLYSDKPRQKVAVDQLQFTLQCCGHTKYDDWIRFDWQKVDYASREEMFPQQRLSDEEFRPFAVPYSCCSLRSMTPCFHMDLSMNAKSINEAGCAEPLSRIVFRNAALAYCVSTFLVLTQILLGFLIVKIVKRPILQPICNCAEKFSSVHQLIESSTSCVSSNGCTSGSDQDCASSPSAVNDKRLCNYHRPSTVASIPNSRGRCSSSSPSPPQNSKRASKSTKNDSAARTRCSGGGGCGTGAARIRPSLHTEHRVPTKRFGQKRGNVVQR